MKKATKDDEARRAKYREYYLKRKARLANKAPAVPEIPVGAAAQTAPPAPAPRARITLVKSSSTGEQLAQALQSSNTAPLLQRLVLVFVNGAKDATTEWERSRRYAAAATIAQLLLSFEEPRQEAS